MRKAFLVTIPLCVLCVSQARADSIQDVLDRFVDRVDAGDAFYLGYPLDNPSDPAALTYLEGSADGVVYSEIGDFSWRWAVKGVAVGLGAVGGGLLAAAAAAPTTGGLGSVPAAIWGAGAAGGAAGTAAGALLNNLPEDKPAPPPPNHKKRRAEAQDISVYGSIMLASATQTVDVTSAYLAELSSALLPAVALPGGASFAASTAIPTSVLDANSLLVPNATAVFGILTDDGTEYPMSIVDYNFAAGDRGILPTDYLDSNADWLIAEYPQFSVGNFVLGTSLFLQTPIPVPEASTWAMMLLGFGGLGFAAQRRAKPKGGGITELR